MANLSLVSIPRTPFPTCACPRSRTIVPSSMFSLVRIKPSLNFYSSECDAISWRGSGLGNSRRLVFRAQSDIVQTSETENEVDLKNKKEILTAFKELLNSFSSIDDDLFAALPNDLRVDLRDAAFSLYNGSVIKECGEDVGTIVVELGQGLEAGDLSEITRALSLLPDLTLALPSRCSERAALGKRLISAGRKFTSMGSFGNGKLSQIAKSFNQLGNVISFGCNDAPPSTSSSSPRTFKFGDLQIQVTSGNAFIGSFISALFSIICWFLGSNVTALSSDNLQYSNTNANILANSLWGSVIVGIYTCVFLGAFASIGLVALGINVSSSSTKS